MSKLIFAFMQAYGGDERESLLLSHSLRTFGGGLADHPLWLMIPQGVQQISASALQELGGLGVQVHRFQVPEDALEFPYGGKVFAAAAAEQLAAQETEILVWMDSDTVFANEPSEFTLGENIILGYRPVMLKNISSLFDEPINSFWEFIYEGCGTSTQEIPLMVTSTDKARIRPQFNAGIMSLRPEKNLLRTWRDNFEEVFLRPELVPFYNEHILYRIFVHQAVLSATLLAMLKKDEMRDMGERINFPVFLDSESETAHNAATLRYDEFRFFDHPDWVERASLDKTLERWLQARLDLYTNR